MTGRGYARCIVDVLQPERDAVQRSAIVSRHDLGLGPPRCLARLSARQRHEGIELRVEGFDPFEERLDQFHRRKSPSLETARRFGDRLKMECLGHGGLLRINMDPNIHVPLYRSREPTAWPIIRRIFIGYIFR